MSPVASYLVETAVTLSGVVALSALVLYGARRAGLTKTSPGQLELLGRLPLDARRSVYLVRAGARTFVLAASEAGLVKLGEFDGAATSTERSGDDR